MFTRIYQLIGIMLLVGCYTTETSPTVTEEPLLPLPPEVIEDNSLLETIEATLEVADDALNKIVEDKQLTERKISKLESEVTNDHEIISFLETQCTEKDSIINEHLVHNELVQKELDSVAQELDSTLNVIHKEYIPQINNLLDINESLKQYKDSLETHIMYLDSLILTSKKLTKTYERD